MVPSRHELNAISFQNPLKLALSLSTSYTSINYAHTSLSRTQPITLTQLFLDRLNIILKAKFETWVDNAPQAYKQDNFITSRTPIIVTSRYGQNQEMNINENDAESWSRHKNFSNTRYISVAIATHFRYRPSKSMSFIAHYSSLDPLS